MPENNETTIETSIENMNAATALQKHSVYLYWFSVFALAGFFGIINYMLYIAVAYKNVAENPVVLMIAGGLFPSIAIILNYLYSKKKVDADWSG